MQSLGSGDSYSAVSSLILENPRGPGATMTAFEENPLFVYAVGRVRPPDSNFRPQEGLDSSATLIRRIIILKPSVIIVADEIAPNAPDLKVAWSLIPRSPARFSRNKAELQGDEGELSWEKLDMDARIPRQKVGTNVRFIHVFNIKTKGSKKSSNRSVLTRVGAQLRLKVTTEARTFHFVLPPADQGAGTISISTSGHKTILESRLLPAGILPHGPEGARLLDLWDSDYRGSRPPLWDIGHTANELVKAVTAGEVHRCRVIDLCCGSGTDAVYLASRGFEVTGLDIAPTALSQARRKAAAAGVSVEWLYADVLNLPSIPPFDFIYDRGCYHVVRDQNLAAYLETVRKLSHPGTKFLLLASRANVQEANAVTAGVSEEEIRFDFANLFDIHSLREISLESNKEQGEADPPGWSVLMTRKEDE